MPAGQSDGELRVLADPAIDLYCAAMLLGHDVVADREAKASSFAGRLGCEEWLKKLVLDLRGNADAIIADTNFHCISEISRRYLQSRLEIRIASFPLVFGGRIEAIAK